jgi:hypothetical protein
MLVSCNCKVLKLYAQPRNLRRRKSNYTTLRDGEGGRYGVISVTNPNYENFNTASPPLVESPDIDSQSFMKMAYKEDDFVDRTDNLLLHSKERGFGELASALNINEIVKGPQPAPV